MLRKPLFRSLVSLLGGFAIFAFLTFFFVLLAAVVFRSTPGAPTRAYLATNLILSCVAALIGGYATASLAPQRGRAHALVLAVMVLLSAASQIGKPQAGQPNWYPLALAIVSPAGAAIGGLLRRQRPQAPEAA